MDQANKSASTSIEKSPMAGYDVITAAVVMALGVAVAVISLGMARPSGWNSAPGLIPLIFAVSLFIMGLGLLISALSRQGVSSLGAMLSRFSFREAITDIGTRRTVEIIALAAIYMLGLAGRLPFEVAGSLFLLACFSIFWRRGGWLKILSISLIVPLSFTLVFKFLFAMLLPGDSIFDRWF